MPIILFIILLAVLILVHEAGHFAAAKIFGIRVDEFGLGFPPRLAGKKIGETVYSLNWIPFGGFVKIFGENPDRDSLEGPESARSFSRKGKWIQAAVLSAGVFGNLVFGWLLMSAGFMSGLPAPADFGASAAVANPRLTVTAVLPGSPAEKAGLKSGDVILSLRAGGAELGQPSLDGAESFIGGSGGSVQVTYLRGSEEGTVSAAPEGGLVPGRRAIGIGMDMIGTLKLPFFEALWEGAKTTGALAATVAIGLFHLAKSAFAGAASLNDVTGPVGIVSMVGDVWQLGIVYLISFTALISVNLAVINLIPFPALDGGRLFFLLIEAIKGSPIRPKVANTINTIGFAALVILMVVITYHDIVKLL